MSDNQPEEQDKGLDFDYLVKGDDVETIVIVKEADKLRTCVDASLNWVPAIHGDGGQYPGADEMDRLEQEGEAKMMPILVIRHRPSDMPDEESLQHIEHQMYLVDPDQVINLIGTGIHMFTEDEEKTNTLMKVLLFAMFAGQQEHDHEDGEVPVSDDVMDRMVKGFEEHLKKQEDDGDKS